MILPDTLSPCWVSKCLTGVPVAFPNALEKKKKLIYYEFYAGKDMEVQAV